MKLHFLQHVHYEHPTNIEKWARERGHSLSKTLLYKGEKLPQLSSFDWLIVLGAPFNLSDGKLYPWLTLERQFVADAMKNDKFVLGICFGAQLIAEILGARVYKNSHKEMGWVPVSLTKEASASNIFRNVPDHFTPFSFHEDTFDIPQGSIKIAESEGCANQGFQYGRNVLGLQFHIEPSEKSLERLVGCCGHKIEKGEFCQTAEEMLKDSEKFRELYSVMERILDNMEKSFISCLATSQRLNNE